MSQPTSPPDYSTITSYWVYHPTKGVPILFAVLFLFSGIMHIYQNFYKFHNRRIAFLLPWAATLFTAGFILREIGAYNPLWLKVFISSQVLIFVAPPVYSGAAYFIFGRLCYYLPYLSPMHPGRIFTTFLGLDVVVEAVGSNGIALVANRGSTQASINTGEILIKVSLFLALTLFVAFLVLVIHFHRAAKAQGLLTHNISIIILTLYVSSFLILFRNTFRTATFFYTYTSFANATESLFYVFEVVPMLFCTYIFNVYPPAKYLPPN